MPSNPNRPQGREQDENLDEATFETSEADAAEQRAVLGEDSGDWMKRAVFDGREGVSEADAVEQLQEVNYDEDDYR